MITPQDIKLWIEEGLPGAEVSVDGDGTHFEARVISKAFEGKNLLERHRLVYEALGDKMRADIHALSLKTLTPMK
ncbi:MAG: BolA family transcriptional regulator [Gammaproteobacteria bacterium RIFCSPHIGHO2_12_FULL_41_15]|nr:MAG: BolA family transcriptional regulator [Gammaproteobacteria bacterium RIFCSPHIGHO2_12_FULL_41_15]